MSRIMHQRKRHVLIETMRSAIMQLDLIMDDNLIYLDRTIGLLLLINQWLPLTGDAWAIPVAAL